MFLKMSIRLFLKMSIRLFSYRIGNFVSIR